MLPLALPVAKPPWSLLGKKLESAVRKALFEFALLNEPKIAVALSGGKDSLTLLFMLKAIAGRGCIPFDITAIHVEGEFSCGAGIDTAFLKKICHHLDVPLVIESSSQKREGLNCYSCSRERRRLLFEAAKKRGITTVAFGHHKDDVAQTLLLNLLHKGEFATMLAKVNMVDYGVTIIRPLLYVAEKDIITFAKKYGFARITCQCPVGQNSMRKKVDTLLAEMEQLFPNARGNLFGAALQYGSDKSNTPRSEKYTKKENRANTAPENEKVKPDVSVDKKKESPLP